MAEIKIKTGGNSVLVGTFVPVGSRNEPNNIKGVSHFLEHMMFKGTKNRTKQEIHESIEQYGGQFNAWTSEEHTMYYAIISNRYVDHAREVIDDMVNNSVFPEEELDKERNVILQELEMYVDTAQNYIFELAQTAVFNDENSGLHLPIIGTRDTVKNLTRQDILDYYKNNYGNQIKLDIGSIYSEERNRIFLDKTYKQETPLYSTENLIVPRKGINQTNMVVTGAFQLKTLKDQFALELFSAIMNGFTGRFFSEVREKHNLAYHTSLYYQVHSCNTVQYWGYAGLLPEKMELAASLMREQLQKPITSEELDFAKKKWIGKHMLGLDNKSRIAHYLIDSTLSGRNYEDFLINYESYIRSITLEDINDLISRMNLDQSKLVALVPEK